MKKKLMFYFFHFFTEHIPVQLLSNITVEYCCIKHSKYNYFHCCVLICLNIGFPFWNYHMGGKEKNIFWFKRLLLLTCFLVKHFCTNRTLAVTVVFFFFFFFFPPFVRYFSISFFLTNSVLMYRNIIWSPHCGVWLCKGFEKISI